MRRLAVSITIFAALLGGGPMGAPAFAEPITRPLPPSARADSGAIFDLGGESLRMPIPAGFCEPAGVYIPFAEKMRAAAPDARLLLFDCAETAAMGPLSHMLIVQTLRMPGITGLSREALVGKMAAMPASAWGQISEDAGDSAADRLKGLGVVKDADMKMGVSPVGVEGGVFYLTSVMRMSGNGRSAIRVAAMGMTVVRGQPLMLTVTRDGSGPDDVAAALAEDNAAIAGLMAANAP